MMRRRVRLILLVGAAVLAATARSEEPTPAPAVTGKVTYRERMALPPDAAVRVRLEVAAEPERPPRRVTEITIPTGGRQIPIPFTLPYEAARIVSQKRYQVRAWIVSGDRVLFATRGAYPVITKGAPSTLEIVVEPARTGARRPLRTPTAGEPELSASVWTLEAQGERPAAAGGGATAEIAFDREKKGISGSTGCNRFFGTYSAADGSALRLSPSGMTLMACSGDASAKEKAFLEALRATASYRISGRTLELLDADGRLLARFASAGEATPPAH